MLMKLITGDERRTEYARGINFTFLLSIDQQKII